MPTLAGKQISNNGLGLMRLTNPQDVTPEDEAFGVLKAALDAGANYWNAADFYGLPTHNSLHLMNRYFTKYPEDADKVVLSVKTGLINPRALQMDCSATSTRNLCDNALKILDGKKKIDIFGPARVDPATPIEETVATLAELKKEGKISGIQLSEVRADTIRRAAEVATIDMVEAEISLWSPEVSENGVAETCAALDIVLVAHTPLGAGLLTGRYKTVDDLPQDAWVNSRPRFHRENFTKNVKFIEALEKLAEEKECTVGQLALNWVKAQSRRPNMPVLIPIAGARAVSRVTENATDLELSDDDLMRINSAQNDFPVAGTRVSAMLQTLNEY